MFNRTCGTVFTFSSKSDGRSPVSFSQVTKLSIKRVFPR